MIGHKYFLSYECQFCEITAGGESSGVFFLVVHVTSRVLAPVTARDKCKTK